MSIKITFKSYIPEVMRKLEGAAERKMFEAVMEVRNQTLETLSGSRTGRRYFVPGTRKLYTASSPGEPPAVATAALRQSIIGTVETKRKVVVGQVGTHLKKSKMLEFGTKKMKPRPWLKKSFEKSVGEIKSIFGGRWFR